MKTLAMFVTAAAIMAAIPSYDAAAIEITVTCSPNPCNGAPDVKKQANITYGKPIISGGHIKVPIGVTNNTDGPYGYTIIRCGFFLGDELVGTGVGGVNSLAPHQAKYTDVVAFGVVRADRAECGVD
jgi:hypothetical protein